LFFFFFFGTSFNQFGCLTVFLCIYRERFALRQASSVQSYPRREVCDVSGANRRRCGAEQPRYHVLGGFRLESRTAASRAGQAVSYQDPLVLLRDRLGAAHRGDDTGTRPGIGRDGRSRRNSP
jgi:hypothetical protein